MLVYVDETGTNYKQENGWFKDSPYIIYAGILIPESKYFHIERVFYDIFKEKLEILDWENKELHASDLWNADPYKFRSYLEELIQFLGKMSVNVVFSIQQKNYEDTTNCNIEIKKVFSSFLQIVEYRLAQLNECGIIIADKSDDDKQNIFNDILYHKIKWRYNPGSKKDGNLIPTPKFKFENRSCLILDQLHFVDSKKSLFIQLIDQICFLLNRVLTYVYLEEFPVSFSQSRPKADESFVPISVETMRLFIERTNLSVSFFDESVQDLHFGELGGKCPDSWDGFIFVNRNFIKKFTPYK
jgi:hypothetical protein